MSEIQHCLPENARVFFLRLRNLKQEGARKTYNETLRKLRGEAAARGVLRSGHQELAEWELSQQFLGDLAYGLFESAVETCTLYKITIDRTLSTCIENSISEFLTVQRRHALQNAGANNPGAIKIPLSVRQSLQDGRNLPRMNEIQIELERASVESLRTAEGENRETAPREEMASLKKQERQRDRPDVLNVLIASPSDVSNERDAATAAIHSWNASHAEVTRILLNPIRFESHAYPETGDRTQAIINKQIVEKGDFLIGIFGSRLGTPTGAAESGTIEEIELFRKAGKHVALYFSEADVPRDVDRAQLEALANYQRERQNDTYYGVFRTEPELRQKVYHDLTKIVAAVGSSLYVGMWAGGQAIHFPSPVIDTEPLLLETEFSGEFPGEIFMHISANRVVRVSQIDFLDEGDLRLSTEKVELEGTSLKIPLKYTDLQEVFKIRQAGDKVVPIHFRLHITDGGKRRSEIVIAGLQPSFKMIQSATTFFLKVLG